MSVSVHDIPVKVLLALLAFVLLAAFGASAAQDVAPRTPTTTATYGYSWPTTTAAYRR